MQRELDELREKEAIAVTKNQEFEAIIASQNVQIGSYDMEKETMIKERTAIAEELACIREQLGEKMREQEMQWSGKSCRRTPSPWLMLTLPLHRPDKLQECNAKLEDAKQREQEARNAQREMASLLSAQEESHAGALTRLQEELAQTASKLRLLEEEQQTTMRDKMELEGRVQGMEAAQTENERKLEEQEQEWTGTV